MNNAMIEKIGITSHGSVKVTLLLRKILEFAEPVKPYIRSLCTSVTVITIAFFFAYLVEFTKIQNGPCDENAMYQRPDQPRD